MQRHRPVAIRRRLPAAITLVQILAAEVVHEAAVLRLQLAVFEDHADARAGFESGDAHLHLAVGLVKNEPRPNPVRHVICASIFCCFL